MTLTVDNYDTVQKACQQARSLAVEIQAFRTLIKNSAWLDQQLQTELDTSLTAAATREKLRVVTTINAAMNPVVAP